MMMGASNLMMGLTLVLVVCLAVVLGLVLVLLAELYCSILLRRRQPPPTTTTTASAAGDHPPTMDNNNTTLLTPPSLNNFYAHGVLEAPRNILYPSIAGAGDVEKQQHEVHRSPENQENGYLRKGCSGNYLFPAISAGAGDIERLHRSPENQENGFLRKGCSGNYSGRREVDEDLVYISNPMYDDGENGRRSRAAAAGGNTPFETPDTSPSRLETEGSSENDDDDDEREEVTSSKMGVVLTPPLTPMKKLPAAVEDGGGGGGGDLNEVSSSSSSETLSLSW